MLKNEENIHVGSLGILNLKKGFYIYIGSAMNGLESRVKRHLSKRKKIHWHVDYLLENSEIVQIYIKDNGLKEECNTAHKFHEIFKNIPKFGSSDCKCQSHLFYSENLQEVKNLLKKMKFVEYQIE
ncbi:MAG: GIY-YIG nuclease family protein [Candidatus Helarchaeota archaeon]